MTTTTKRNNPKRVLKFARCLKLVEGEMAGKFFRPMAWHKEVINGIFGPVDDDGFRKVREAYISVPRKNSKTSLMAVLSCWFLFAEGEPGAQIYICASSTDQASVCFRMITGMIRQQPTLKSMCRITEYRHEILVPETNSKLKVLSKLAEQGHGLNPSLVIYDELHLAKKRDLYDAMITGMGARRQPLMVAITTAGHDRRSLAFEKYRYGKSIIAGTIKDDSFYAYISEPEDGDDWHDPKVWEKVNPAWGISIKPSFIETQFRQAVNTPSFENTFRQLYLNEWVSQSQRWLSMKEWDEAGTDVTLDECKDVVFTGGLDLSATQDMTAFVLCGDLNGKDILFPFFFLPSETVSTHKTNRAFYEGWANTGQLLTSVGNVIDYDYIVDFIAKLGERVKITDIAYDAWNSSYPVAKLEEAGFKMWRFPQSFSQMSAPSKDFEVALKGGNLLHDKNEVLRWCADNVEVISDRAGNIKPTKPSEDAKIDGIVAAIMARDLRRKINQDSFVYEERGMVTL
jgi:phage terminase large subunit-like protein